jgi:hypothetical protein
MWRAIVHAARSLLARPSFALAAIVTIALGAGANVAVFSYIHALLLRPRPFRDPAAIVFVHTLIRGQKQGLAYREVQDIRERGRSFSGVAAYSDGAHCNLTSGKIPKNVAGTMVTRDLFAVLGATLSRGEVWSESSDQRRSFDVPLSHKLWMTQFDSDPKIVGCQITMIDVPYTVRWVLPPGFDFPDRTGIFRCWGTSPLATSYTSRLRAASLGCLRLVGVGLAAGLVLSWWLSGFISQLIFDTAAHDPAVFAGAALFLSVTSVVAILAPAGRALRLDPISALRNTL